MEENIINIESENIPEEEFGEKLVKFVEKYAPVMLVGGYFVALWGCERGWKWYLKKSLIQEADGWDAYKHGYSDGANYMCELIQTAARQ